DGVSLTRQTDGSGNLPNSNDADKLFADAGIQLSPLTAANAVGAVHKVTVTVEQNDGIAAGQSFGGFTGDNTTGFGPAPNRTKATITLPTNTANAILTDRSGHAAPGKG